MNVVWLRGDDDFSCRRVKNTKESESGPKIETHDCAVLLPLALPPDLPPVILDDFR